jgi:hypothetical protein
MNRSKFSAGLALSLIVVPMIVAPLIGGSVFAQAAILGAGLILAAIVCRPGRPTILLAIFHVACVFLMAIIESGGQSKMLPVWLYGGLAFPYWYHIQGKRRLSCRRSFCQLRTTNSIK